MLDLALQFLKGELNAYLVARTNSGAVEVKVSKVVDESGKYAFEEGSICAAVINVEEERVFKSQLPQYEYVDGQHVVREPELKLNLDVLFAANFKLYDQALKFLSYVVTYFQSHGSFNSEAYPALDRRIGKLKVELQSLNYEQLSHIWGYVGGKQLPSAVYKVRLVVIQDETQASVQPPLTVIQADLNSQ